MLGRIEAIAFVDWSLTGILIVAFSSIVLRPLCGLLRFLNLFLYIL